jgi:hypothetical protein
VRGGCDGNGGISLPNGWESLRRWHAQGVLLVLLLGGVSGALWLWTCPEFAAAAALYPSVYCTVTVTATSQW